MYCVPSLEQIAKQVKSHRYHGTSEVSGDIKGIRGVAKEIGVSSATLSRLENGKSISVESYIKVCKWLDQQGKMLIPASWSGTQVSP